jgi:transposase-like protein
MKEKKGKKRVIDAPFREGAVRRMESGENVCALSRELEVRRSVLYRWREAWRREGAAGLRRSRGRPLGGRDGQQRAKPADAAAGRVAELERLVGRQAAQISFLKRAFEQVNAGQAPGEPGASGSTRRSAKRSGKKAR